MFNIETAAFGSIFFYVFQYMNFLSVFSLLSGLNRKLKNLVSWWATWPQNLCCPILKLICPSYIPSQKLMNLIRNWVIFQLSTDWKYHCPMQFLVVQGNGAHGVKSFLFLFLPFFVACFLSFHFLLQYLPSCFVIIFYICYALFC